MYNNIKMNITNKNKASLSVFLIFWLFWGDISILFFVFIRHEKILNLHIYSRVYFDWPTGKSFSPSYDKKVR